MSEPRKLTDLRLMQIKEKMLHGEFVYSHGLDLLDHIAALSAELAQVRGELEEAQHSGDLWMIAAEAAKAEVERLDAKCIRLQCRVERLFDFIKHGDDEHQRWLRNAILDHFKDVSWPSLEKALAGEGGT